jgi:hypothetical protein
VDQSIIADVQMRVTTETLRICLLAKLRLTPPRALAQVPLR